MSLIIKNHRLFIGAPAMSQNAVVHINQNRGSTGFRYPNSTIESRPNLPPAWILKRFSTEKTLPFALKSIGKVEQIVQSVHDLG
jgi:hypothetical protein